MTGKKHGFKLKQVTIPAYYLRTWGKNKRTVPMRDWKKNSKNTGL